MDTCLADFFLGLDLVLKICSFGAFFKGGNSHFSIKKKPYNGDLQSFQVRTLAVKGLAISLIMVLPEYKRPTK
jgi:hypothetical protein